MDKSVGIIVYRGEPRKYLALFKHGKTDFAKGRHEAGESDEEAARREVEEETGITEISLQEGFRRTNRYTFRRGKTIRKRVDFYLGSTPQKDVKISDEHDGYVWLTAKQAMSVLSFSNQKSLIRKAEEFLKQ